MTREPGRAPLSHAHGDLTSLAPHESPPGSQASSRGEAKDSALLSSRDAGLLEPPERPQWTCLCLSKTLVLLRFNFQDETPTTNFDTFPAAILTVFQVRLPALD